MALAAVDWSVSGLPSCPQNWQEQPNDNVIRSQTESGLLKARQRYTRQLLKVSFSNTLPRSSYQLWKSFFEQQLLGGVVAFNYKHPYTGKMMKLLLSDTPVVSMGATAFTLSIEAREVL